MTNIKLLDKELPVKLEWLRSFIAVADVGGFSKAARHLHLSQPAVSTHVKELEENLGTELFEKIGGRVRLTRPGEAAIGEARAVLDGVRRFRDAALESEDSVGGALSVGASTTPGNYVLPRILGKFKRLHPEVRTSLSIGNSSKILARLAANEVDLGAVGIEPPPKDFVAKRLLDDEIVVFAPKTHPLTRVRRPVTASELSKELFILRESDSATRRLGDAWFAKNRFHPPIMELGCPETVKRAVAAGLGLGILSRFAIGREAGETEFAPLRVTGFPIRRPLYVVYLRRKRLTKTMRSFLDLLSRE
jgi:DNA-binding transcriptional LysR family regulator